MTFATLARQDGIAIVTLNRPDRLNAMSLALNTSVAEVLEEANGDPAVGAIVFTGTGRAFCAGDDLKEFDQQSASAEAIRAHIEAIQRVTRALMLSEKIVVGAIHGYAVGGGFEWLLNCDMVVAADDLVAFFPEMDWGQFVTGGVTHLLPQSLGHQRAMELLVLGERQSAADLLRHGIVNWVVPKDEMLPRALAVATKVAEKSRFSTGRLKRVMTRDLSDQLSRAIEIEAAITMEAFARTEAAERVKNFAKRKGAK